MRVSMFKMVRTVKPNVPSLLMSMIHKRVVRVIPTASLVALARLTVSVMAAAMPAMLSFIPNPAVHIAWLPTARVHIISFKDWRGTTGRAADML